METDNGGVSVTAINAALLTPHDVHHGNVNAKLVRRRAVLAAAFSAHPERFPRGAPTPEQPRSAVWINPPKPTKETIAKEDAVA